MTEQPSARPNQVAPPEVAPTAARPPTGERPSVSPADQDDGGVGLVAHLLGAADGGANQPLREAEVVSWAEDRGMLADGQVARLGASCLLRPEAGDRVLVWSNQETSWVLNVLQRANKDSPAVLATDAPSFAIQAPKIALAGEAVHIAAKDFLTSARNRHAVETSRTETCRIRVSQVGTDIRRAVTVDDDVSGTLLQRTGTWLSNTVRDARLRARAFLFD